MPAWGFPDTVKATDLAEMMGKERKDINQALKLLNPSLTIKIFFSQFYRTFVM